MRGEKRNRDRTSLFKRDICILPSEVIMTSQGKGALMSGRRARRRKGEGILAG